MTTPLQEKEITALQKPDVLKPMALADDRQGWQLTPKTDKQVAQLLMLAQDKSQPMGFSAAEALDLNAPVWMSLEKLNKVLWFRPADLTIKVETGITMGKLQRALAKEKLMFPLSYPSDMTLLDVLAEDLPALESGQIGYPRDYVLGLEIATPDGDITKCGGDVVKNVTGYDLNKLYVGSHNNLGVITAATIKVVARPEMTSSWLLTFGTQQELLTAVDALKQNEPTPVWCEMIQEESWQLAVQFRGAKPLVKKADKFCQGLNSNCMSLNKTMAADLMRDLTQWPKDELAIEAAVTPNHSQAFCEQARTLLAEYAPLIQCRPTAGLIYLHWPKTNTPSPDWLWKNSHLLNALNTTAKEFGGFIRLHRFPQDYQHIANAFNVPADEIAQLLMTRLKSIYDPNHILYSRMLSLGGNAHG